MKIYTNSEGTREGYLFEIKQGVLYISSKTDGTGDITIAVCSLMRDYKTVVDLLPPRHKIKSLNVVAVKPMWEKLNEL